MAAEPGQHEGWSSRLTFIFATVGAAIGLGNLWRFPYVAGENGGGAFVLVYLAMVFLILLPLVMAELAMGRRGHQSPVTTMGKLCREQNAHPFWRTIGWLSVLAPLGALTFYSVVAGWSLDYIIKAVLGKFANISAADAEATFDSLLASPGWLLLWYSLYIAATVYVISRGVRHGIEGVVSLMLPALVAMLVLLVIYAHIIGDPSRAWVFLFNPDFSKLTVSSLLIALGQALFSVTVGTGALLTYGAYLSKNAPIVGPSWVIIIGDTLAAMMAGLAIFPIVFASGLDPADGPGLMFVTLPVALGQMPGGHVISIVFFILVFFAAFTSSLAMLEPFVFWLEDRGFDRTKVAICTGLAVWTIGISAVLSFNVLGDFTPLSFIPLYEGKNIFSILDFTVSNVMLPINAFLIALFVGWVFDRDLLRAEIGLVNHTGYALWSFLVRYVTPVAVAFVVVFSFLE